MFSSSPKIVLQEEEPGSTVKIWHHNDIADQARNDVIGCKLVLIEAYRRVVEP